MHPISLVGGVNMYFQYAFIIAYIDRFMHSYIFLHIFVKTS